MQSRLAELGYERFKMATLVTEYKPYLAYKPTSVDWIGEIPAHWEITKLA